MKKFILSMLALCVSLFTFADEVTFDWSSVTTTQTPTAENVYTQAPITLTFGKGTGSNLPAENKEGSIRMYAGSTLTITAEEGYVVSHVEFTPTGTKYTAANLTCTIDGTEGLVADSWDVPTAQQELVLNAGANARFKTIVVTYEAVAVPNVKKPTFSVAAGTYYDAQSVEIACATEGATIQYNTDGATWQDYTAAVTIDKTCTLSARAILNPDTSLVASSAYVIAEKFANLYDLCNVTPAGQPVIVTLNNVKIDSLYLYKGASATYTNGLYLTSGNDNHQQVEIYCKNVPEGWQAGGYISGTLRGLWKQYTTIWEVCPDSYDGLTYVYPYVTDGDYYLQNVESGLFLCGANSWGTQASVTTQGEVFTLASTSGTYTLTDTALSCSAKTLGSNLYTDSSAEKWTFEPVDGEEGVYTIKNGNGYIAQSATAGGHIGYVAEQVAEVTAAAKWYILTKDEAVAKLAAATQTAPVNASFLIGDANFSRNHSNTAWTITAGNKNMCGGDNNNKCAESWCSTFDMSQTLTVPNGVYALTAQAALTDYTNAYDGVDYPVVLANEATAPFNSMTGSDIASNMNTLSNSFASGKYAVGPIYTQVTDGTLKIGILGTRTDTWCIWDNFNVTYYGTEASIAELKAAEALEGYVAATGKKMNSEVSDAMEAAKTAYDADPTDENLATLTAAVNEATASVTAYANAATALENMKALTEATNFYTADALDAYYTQPAAKYEDGTLTTDEANALQNPYAETGWHASLTADDLLLSAWKINDVQCQDYNAGMYINTWSVEGDTDGSEFKVPFFEYWTGDANSLGAATITGTIEGLTAGTYDVTAWVRVRLNNNSTDQTATGITFNGVDACAGEQVGTTQFRLMQVAATAEVGEDGVLTATFEVADGNNISWLSFQNVNYKKQPELLNTFVAIPTSGYLLTGDFKATFKEYDDHIEILSYDGTEGHDMIINWEGDAYTTINGEAATWIDLNDPTYYCAYVYATDGYTAGNWDENGGEFWIGGWAYDNDGNSTWGYIDYTLCKDYTDAIVNADLATTDAWNQDETKGISGNLCKVSSGKVFDFSQTINLPAGKYQLTANAAYRYSGSEADEYTAIAAGTETHLAKLYATTATYEYVGDVKNRYEGATDAALDGTSAVEVNGKYVPNSSADVQTYMNAGQYVNNVVFNVQEDGAVKIGIRKTESPEAGDYTVIGTWSLIRLGDAEADPSPETVDIAGTWYENTTGMYYGSDWEDFSLTDNEVTVAVEGTTATFTGLLGDTTNGLTATIDGTTLTFAKGQTIAYGGYDWELGTEDSDGAEADLVGTISEDGKTITLDGINIFYSGYSYMYSTQVTLTRDKAEEPSEGIDFADNIIVLGEQAMTVVPCTDMADISKWYLLKQKRGGVTPAYDNGENKTLMRAATDCVEDGAAAADYAQYLVRFIPTENEGAYYIQFGTGRYFGTSLVASTTPGEYNVYNINGEDGHIGINLYDMGSIVDNNAAGNTLAFWSTGEIPSIDGNNDWTIWDVEVRQPSEEEKAQAERNELFAALLATADSAYNANQVYTKGEGLITSVDQLSSPYTEASEGSLDALLDGNTSTFWHSSWSDGDVDAGIHYLEIALPEGTMGDIELDLTRRPVANDHLTKADIVGVDAEGNTTVIATIDLPYVSNTETVTATFTLDQAYTSIRIVEQATNANRGYWHASEIQLYAVSLAEDCYNAQNPVAADGLKDAIATAKTVENASQEDIDALQAAYDAYLAGDPDFAYTVESYLGSYYEGTVLDVDLDAILAKIEATDMSGVTVYSEEPDGTRTNSVRGNTDGWRDATGKFEYWGNAAYFYVQDNADLPGQEYYLGGYPGKTDEPCSFTAKLVYVNNATSAEASVGITLSYVEAPEVEVAAIDSIEVNVTYESTDGSYTEKIVSLTDEQVSTICSELGLSALVDGDVYGYNPTTGEYLTSYTSFDGWRDVNGDFHSWTGDATVPYCVKVYDDGLNYYCYNIQGCTTSATCYWAIANAEGDAVLVKVNFTYKDASKEVVWTKTAVVTNMFGDESGKEVSVSQLADGSYIIHDWDGVEGHDLAVATDATTHYVTEINDVAVSGTAQVECGDTIASIYDYSYEYAANTDDVIDALRLYVYTTEFTMYQLTWNEDIVTRIAGVAADSKKEIYNVNGVKLNKMQRGINIVNGKKVFKK